MIEVLIVAVVVLLGWFLKTHPKRRESRVFREAMGLIAVYGKAAEKEAGRYARTADTRWGRRYWHDVANEIVKQRALMQLEVSVVEGLEVRA